MGTHRLDGIRRSPMPLALATNDGLDYLERYPGLINALTIDEKLRTA